MSTPIIEHMEVYPGLSFRRFSIDELEKASQELETQAETTHIESLQYVYTQMAQTIRKSINRRKQKEI